MAGSPRRRRQVWWGRRIRRLGLAWENALEIARAGRLTAPYGAAFEVIHQEKVYRLRRYANAARLIAEPLLLIPPLMVASEVYDISPDVSAVAYLTGQGVDVWLADFGAPEREQDGMNRTLDDHIRAVSDAIDRVRTATGRDVHIAGYSQGGMFCYEAAAFRRSAGVASIIAMGSPVDLHRQLAIDEDLTERLTAGLRSVMQWPLARIEGLPSSFTAPAFKLFSARKEVSALFDFVRNLHDRAALEKREAKRLFLGGQGFVAWPGPAFRKFVDEVVVGNRLASGGFVVDGHTVTLADLTCPILYFVGSRDEMGRPGAVRGIRRAAPHVRKMYEIPLKAGHFGLVVGTTAITVTWPSVVAWMRGEIPEAAVDVLAGDVQDLRPEDEHDADHDPEHDDSMFELAKDVVESAARTALILLEGIGEDLGHYLDNARFQVPRLTKLRNLQDDSFIGLGRTLGDQAAKIGDRTFFLWRGRAFTFADANRRVDAIVRGLIACGMKPGMRIGVMMKSRPSHLSVVAAINRLGAVAVLISPETRDEIVPRAFELGETEVVIVDPENAARTRALTAIKILVLGGVGEQGDTRPGEVRAPRAIPAGVIDLETIDPSTITLPAWYKPDPGRARDLAMIFVTSGAHEPARAHRVTNRRWAISALGAAAAATLTTRDTVYCCLPLHHPSGTLVATGSAIASGARLALASQFEPATFWDEVRRYGVNVVFYAGEMCRRLVDAAPVVGEQNNPVRLFAGSGMRPDVWRRLVDRFGPVGVLELYASTEASAVLANTAGKKVGSVGRPLPGSAHVAVAAWDERANELVRDAHGFLVHARLDEPGMLVAELARTSSELGHIDPTRILRAAFETGDAWFITGDFMRVDTEGDYWFVDRQGQMVRSKGGLIASTRIEDALYAYPAVALCIVAARPVELGFEAPIAALQLRPGTTLELDALGRAVKELPEFARPRRVHVIAQLPMTDGYRVIKAGLPELDRTSTTNVYAWDPRVERYVTAPSLTG